ncbi:MAG: DUF58 domain-containing protein [Alphaproteobacteria bacterium]
MTTTVTQLEQRAGDLSQALPALMVEAARIANSVTLGEHGQRRAGQGETFWQYRQFRDGDNAQAIDWRKSARSHRLYVRENEWEAASTVLLWVNRAETMDFRSHLARETKAQRAATLLLALAMVLGRAGERVALLGDESARPRGAVVARLAQALTAPVPAPSGERAASGDLPPVHRIKKNSSIVLFSDFLAPIETLSRQISALAGNELRGHIVQILAPAVETFPYSGRLEISAPAGDRRMLVGRAQNIASAYRRRIESHRRDLRQLARRVGWTYTLHHSDTNPTPALLGLHGLLSGNFR